LSTAALEVDRVSIRVLAVHPHLHLFVQEGGFPQYVDLAVSVRERYVAGIRNFVRGHRRVEGFDYLAAVGVRECFEGSLRRWLRLPRNEGGTSSKHKRARG